MLRVTVSTGGTHCVTFLTMNPVAAMPIVIAAFAALMLGVCAGRGRLGAEGSRKAMHIGMGVVTLSFPWLFSETWPVFVLTGGFVALLLALRCVPTLRARFGEVLGGVGRSSAGDLFFPVAIGVLFYITRGAPLDYFIAVLVLTFADAVAALVGTRFGRHRYDADEGEKSREGSLAFLATAFICVFVPLIAAGRPVQHSAFTAVCIALVTMLAEATAWRGLDNLFIPFATAAMLAIYRDETYAALWGRIGVLGFLAALHIVWRKRTQLREGTLLGALVLIFVFWNIGSPAWAFAPLTLLVLHPLPGLWNRADAVPQSHHALLSVALPPLAWLFAWRFFGVKGFAPALITFAAQLAMMCASVWRTDQRRIALLPLAAGVGWLCIIAPRWGLAEITAHIAGMSAAATGAAIVVFHVLLPRLHGRPREHWTARAVLASFASLSVFSL